MSSELPISDANMVAWNELCAAIESDWSPSRWVNVGVVVGCSGGADSLALAMVLCELARRHRGRGFVLLAHYNHGLRGKESDDDATFVRQIAQQCECPFVTEKYGDVDGSPIRSGESSPPEQDDPGKSEADLRRHRLSFLQRTAERSGARYVALAHHRNDQVETVLHHLMRGTGPAGLTGIPRHRTLGDDVVLMRPMLNVGRETIRQALREQERNWREDSSNQLESYTRNWIRQVVLPIMRQRFPQVDQAIARASDSIDAWRETVDHLAENWLDQAVAIRFADDFEGASMQVARRAMAERSIVIRGLQIAWDRIGWSRGAMTSRHWSALVEMINGADDLESTGEGGADSVSGQVSSGQFSGKEKLDMLPQQIRVSIESDRVVIFQ